MPGRGRSVVRPAICGARVRKTSSTEFRTRRRLGHPLPRALSWVTLLTSGLLQDPCQKAPDWLRLGDILRLVIKPSSINKIGAQGTRETQRGRNAAGRSPWRGPTRQDATRRGTGVREGAFPGPVPVTHRRVALPPLILRRRAIRISAPRRWRQVVAPGVMDRGDLAVGLRNVPERDSGPSRASSISRRGGTPQAGHQQPDLELRR